ncbi:MAG: nucleoside 2-deoxyribosyltransferase [Candidatus Methylarchaceae archaeon HK01B]|nr:nucleoside 2-deoxyribosyltransferase [Candidatus Methylarchaceae archaeon HK01M]MCP8312741.1 nucleoside 2-deoxyribosyltransferase [Candidatus Methylarchaceae archaeon HK02M1]MCP8318972.1 nucleoside 2-deoxyribosyltransferase [Candidatus Methylarchaceae archaeon HK01B]
MKIVVCGSIGDKGVSEIREIQSLLKKEGFDVIDQISYEDYSQIKDFRDKKYLAEDITKHDLDFIRESDVVVALFDGPSYGVAVEIYFAKQMGKKVVFMSKRRVSSPWPIALSDRIVYDEEQLVSTLKELRNYMES